ncbi:MAG: L,D-transpeptidase family protein [Aggregatilineales bacterium]
MQMHATQPPRQNLPPVQKKKTNWLPYIFIGGALTLVISMLVAVVLFIGIVYLAQERIPSATTVAGLDIGGETLDSAAEMIATINVSNNVVRLVDQERSWDVTLGQLGVSVDTAATLEAAKQSTGSLSLQPVLKIDLATAQQALLNVSYEANIDAIPGETSQIGRSLEIPVTVARLNSNLQGEISDGVLELDMMVIDPPEYDPVIHYDGATTTHIIEAGQELALIAREYGVTIDDLVAMNDISDPNLIFVGQELIVPSAGEFIPENVPPAPTATGRSIVVDTNAQRIYAYENGEMVHTHLTSTGRSQTPTVLGDYNIYVKYTATDMRGADYYLQDVPYTMYFYQGYGIHGTYWHNSFGRPMSHGCVNLPIDEAEWFFNFASVGTLVRVI